jgi:hypothetical protein
LKRQGDARRLMRFCIAALVQTMRGRHCVGAVFPLRSVARLQFLGWEQGVGAQECGCGRPGPGAARDLPRWLRWSAAIIAAVVSAASGFCSWPNWAADSWSGVASELAAAGRRPEGRAAVLLSPTLNPTGLFTSQARRVPGNAASTRAKDAFPGASVGDER